jgi:membrane-bound inhibitor of C-type lysozyme
MIAKILVLIVFAGGCIAAAPATINLLGVIYGSGTQYCDAFYYAQPLCVGKRHCSIPLNGSLVCLQYGTVGSADNVNIMHANYACDDTFVSVNIGDGQADSLTLTCDGFPATLAADNDDDRVSDVVAFEKVAAVRDGDDVPAVGSINFLGAVIGSENQYCDAYFKIAPLCQNRTECTLPIVDELCSIGLPKQNSAYSEMHIMYSCGQSFSRVDVRQSEKIVRFSC